MPWQLSSKRKWGGLEQGLPPFLPLSSGEKSFPEAPLPTLSPLYTSSHIRLSTGAGPIFFVVQGSLPNA